MRKSIPILVATFLAAVAAGAAEIPGTVTGRVLGETSPLSAARVYAYQLNDLSLQRVLTDGDGKFRFESLPAGLYKIIAHKSGFLPAVVLLTRTTAKTSQFLELQLAQGEALAPAAGEDFWSIRSRIPADVLRDIETIEIQQALLPAVPQILDATTAPNLEASLARFRAEMQALSGVEQSSAAGEGTLTGGEVGIEGRVGQVEVGLSGSFMQLESGFQPGLGVPAGGGQASAMSLDIASGPGSRVRVASLSNRLARDAGAPVGIEDYQVSWTQGIGESGHSEVSAGYTTESNYHRHGWIDPAGIPESSRTWRVEGSFATALGDSSTLRTGVRYRQRQLGLLDQFPGQERVDFFSVASSRPRPAVLVEYGLYTTLRDGSLSLTPHGGLVLQLGPKWQAEASFSERAYEEPVLGLSDFLPTLYRESDLCEEAGESCYQVRLSRAVGEDDLVSFAAVQRTFGDTLRLYFSEDFFDRLESLYLVPGDELPEAQVTVTKRLAPQVLATLESSLATGGGGIFHATDARAYENQVRYVVTSLDTRFQGTSTGVFVAFHHLTQGLEPLDGKGPAPVAMDIERLQLMLTQDLNFLLEHLAADWAVHINMEVSRGAIPAADAIDPDELRKRFVGGLAVRF